MASVRIDVSKACEELRRKIASMFSVDGAGGIAVQGSIKQIKEELEKKLPEDYIVAENSEDPSELAVLKKGDLEQLGVYVCSFCASVFKSEIERNVHQRVHLFGFG
jgi:hypothetical protein